MERTTPKPKKHETTILLFLLSALGFSNACKSEKEHAEPSMYGVPRIDFRIQGRVTDPAGDPIPGIEIRNEDLNWGNDNTTQSDTEGRYDLRGSAFCEQFDLSFHDIDGPKNGGPYATRSRTIRFTEEERVQAGDGWLRGAYARTEENVVLEEQSVQQE